MENFVCIIRKKFSTMNIWEQQSDQIAQYI